MLNPIPDAGNEAINGMPWLRGEAGDQAFNPMNFQSAGMFPWMQQRFDSTGLRNDLNHQYQAMLLQNFGGGEMLKHQLMQFQQPIHYLQQQQVGQPTISSHSFPLQTQMLSDNMQRSMHHQAENHPEEHPQRHTYQEAYLAQHDQLQQRQPSSIPSSSFTKSEFENSASMAHPNVQNMLGSFCPEGSGNNLLNFSRTGQPTTNEEPSQHSWVQKFGNSPVSGGSNSKMVSPYSGNEASIEQETSNLDVQTQALFGANIDSCLLLPTTVSNIGTSSVQDNMFNMPLGASGYQSPLYGQVQDSSEILHNTGQVDQPAQSRSFVKVLVKRNVFSLDYFNCYRQVTVSFLV